MSKKKHTLLPSQTIGILWLSAALLIAAGAAFFSLSRSKKPQQIDITLPSEQENLPSDDVAHNAPRQHNRYRQTTHSRTTSTQAHTYHLDTTSPSSLRLPSHKQPLVVDLNRADTLTLQLLPGIGPTFARRIASYRHRIGGFLCAQQLLEVYGFTPEMLRKIEPNLYIDSTAIRHIAINSIGLKELSRHPYIEYYQARDIVRLRQRGATFRTIDDLKAIPSMADSTLQRIIPYITFASSVDTSSTPNAEPTSWQ